MFKSLSVLLLIVGCTSTPLSTKNKKHDTNSAKFIHSITPNWMPDARNAVTDTVNRYGAPEIIEQNSVTWLQAGPFERIVVHRFGSEHNFPRPHRDIVEHVVTYKIPLEKVDDLLSFHESLVINRQRGEVSAFSDNQEGNIMALNLAHQIIENQISVNEARERYVQLYLAGLGGNRSRLTSDISFPAQTATDVAGENIEKEAQEEEVLE